MMRVTIGAGTWPGEPPPPQPVQYVVEVRDGHVPFAVLNGTRDGRGTTLVHSMQLTADEAREIGRALLIAGMEAR